MPQPGEQLSALPSMVLGPHFGAGVASGVGGSVGAGVGVAVGGVGAFVGAVVGAGVGPAGTQSDALTYRIPSPRAMPVQCVNAPAGHGHVNALPSGGVKAWQQPVEASPPHPTIVLNDMLGNGPVKWLPST